MEILHFFFLLLHSLVLLGVSVDLVNWVVSNLFVEWSVDILELKFCFSGSIIV